MGNPKCSSTQALLWNSVCRSVTSDSKVTGGTGKVETSTKTSRSLFFSWGPGSRATKKKHKGVWETDRIRWKVTPVGWSATEVEQEVGEGRRFAFSLISLNNNSRLNPQEFGLSPRKGMNLIIFDPFSNKKSFQTLTFKLQSERSCKEFVYSLW